LLAAAERRLAEERFTTVVTALSEGIVVVQSDGIIRSMNPAAKALLGERVAEGSNAFALLASRRLVDARGHRLRAGHGPLDVALATGVSQRDNVFGVVDEHRRRRWFSMSSEALERRPDGRVDTIVCSITDVTERRAGEERLTHAAAHDSLTGLSNRTQLLAVLGDCLATGVEATVLFVDLDRFKAVNDTHGHIAGDRVLCTVASRIRQLVEPSGTVGRLAGDEFVIIMPRSTEPAATRAAQLIRQSVAQPIRVINGRDVIVTASIGIASTVDNEATAEAVLGDADMAMYRAKQRGRARIEVFDAALRAARSRRLDLADRLRRAVTDEQIEVHYQPIVRFDTGRTVGYEALARWTDPDLGPVPPAEFIPVAEDHGLVVQLGRNVLLQACWEAASWFDQAGGVPPDISVNISAHQLSDPQLTADVRAALSVSGLAPGRLCLEVTESVLMDDVGANVAVLDDLRSAGVRLVIDDFGTGYSSLNYLRRLPVDGIKIDRSFVTELGIGTDDDAIVDAIIHLGHSLGLTITAEGVETPEQAAILSKLGCDTAQGYLYGRPDIAVRSVRPSNAARVSVAAGV
jgi:diguanylate cyclase (GGDEF)-like protein